MIEPCTIEQLKASCISLRVSAVAAGRRFELAKVNGAKMPQLWVLQTEQLAAWGRYYAVDERLHRELDK